MRTTVKSYGIVTLVVSLSSGYALAQYSTGAHVGAECQVDYPNEGGTPYKAMTVANNHSVSDLNVTCPLTRFETVDAPEAVVVEVYDGSSSEGVACRVKCLDYIDHSESQSSLETSASTGFKVLTIDDTGYEDGKCFMLCEIPNVNTGTSEVISYTEDWDG
jgi:hypothetical protein